MLWKCKYICIELMQIVYFSVLQVLPCVKPKTTHNTTNTVTLDVGNRQHHVVYNDSKNDLRHLK